MKKPAKKSVVALAYELMAADERKQKKVKKDAEPAAPAKKASRKGKAK